MRTLTTLILLLSLALPASAVAERFSGRVKEVDPENGILLVEPFRAGHHGAFGGGKGHGMGHGGGHRGGHGGRHGGGAGIVVYLSGGAPPPFVKAGAMVRLSGEFISGERRRFRADGLQPFEGYDNDPTGVRQRLWKHSGGCRSVEEGEGGETP